MTIKPYVPAAFGDGVPSAVACAVCRVSESVSVYCTRHGAPSSILSRESETEREGATAVQLAFPPSTVPHLRHRRARDVTAASQTNRAPAVGKANAIGP